MLAMKPIRFSDNTNLRNHPPTYRDSRRKVIGMEGRPEARFAGREVTYEAATNALWQWFGRLTDDEAAAFLGRELPALERSMRGEAAGPPPAPAAPEGEGASYEPGTGQPEGTQKKIG
jgi:hypothetical protein